MVEYISKQFKNKVNYESLCREKLVFFSKGYIGKIFKYKNFLVKRTPIVYDEANMLKKINTTKYKGFTLGINNNTRGDTNNEIQ